MVSSGTGEKRGDRVVAAQVKGAGVLCWHWCLLAAGLGSIGFFFGGVAAQAGPVAEARSVRSLLEMRHENVVIQKWDFSCGTAALATLLNYQFGDPVTEQEIARVLIRREEYVASPELIKVRQGFSLLDLKRYVDGRGYEGIGYGQLILQDLIKSAPIMVPIGTNGYNHFIIFRGIWKNRVLLADPAWGNRTTTVEQFESMWLDFPKIGKVGFVVKSDDPQIAAKNHLAPRPEEFLTLN